MKTTHRIFHCNAQDIGRVASQSIDLVVTSPPYPMIAMWDETFSGMNNEIADALNAEKNCAVFCFLTAIAVAGCR